MCQEIHELLPIDISPARASFCEKNRHLECGLEQENQALLLHSKHTFVRNGQMQVSYIGSNFQIDALNSKACTTE